MSNPKTDVENHVRVQSAFEMNIKANHVFITVVLVFVLTAGALTMFLTSIKVKTDTNKMTLPSIDDVPKECWAKLAEKRIFFGHKSVGSNIIEGINDIIDEREYIRLNIVQTDNCKDFDQPIFAHSSVGRNTEPASKMKSFRSIMDAGIGKKVDIAFFKFCFVDITRDSDPREILDNYRALMEDMKVRYPQARFLHATVPLCSVPRGVKRPLKECAKLLIGRPRIMTLDDNIMRQRYNTLLRDAYSQTQHVFDLALIESVNPDGFRCYATKGTEKVFVMVPEYTDDGGHLNEEGRKKIAEQLLIILAEVANKL